MRHRTARTARAGRVRCSTASSTDVTIRGYWLNFPQHTTYLVVETDAIAALQKFLAPGAKVATCEITPVSDEPAP